MSSPPTVRSTPDKDPLPLVLWLSSDSSRYGVQLYLACLVAFLSLPSGEAFDILVLTSLLFLQVVSQLFQQRIVRLGGPIEDEMANLCVAQLLYLDSVNPKADITLYVNVSFPLLAIIIFFTYPTLFIIFLHHYTIIPCVDKKNNLLCCRVLVDPSPLGWRFLTPCAISAQM